MLKRIVAVTAVALALGLTACDKGGQEQAQTPKNRDQTTTTTTQTPPPSAAPSQPAPGSTTTEQAPTTAPPEGTSRGTGSTGQ